MDTEPRVVVTDYIEPDLDWEHEELARAGVALDAHALADAPADDIVAACRGADVIVTNMARMSRSVVERLDRCRLIIRHGIGYDNVDVDACSERGIAVANQPTYCVDEVAEHAIALILGCLRGLPGAEEAMTRSVDSGRWWFESVFPLRRFDRRTVGLIGIGRIGRRVAQFCGSLSIRVLGCDPAVRAEDLPTNAILVPLERLLHESDVVSLHAPADSTTHHMIDNAHLRLMKPTAYLVNTARASLVDTEALVAALRDHRIAGAAIDVFDVEPPKTRSAILSAPRCLRTPHIGWASEESGWEIRRAIVRDIVGWKNGRLPGSVVNLDRLGLEPSRGRR